MSKPQKPFQTSWQPQNNPIGPKKDQHDPKEGKTSKNQKMKNLTKLMLSVYMGKPQ